MIFKWMSKVPFSASLLSHRVQWEKSGLGPSMPLPIATPDSGGVRALQVSDDAFCVITSSLVAGEATAKPLFRVLAVHCVKRGGEVAVETKIVPLSPLKSLKSLPRIGMSVSLPPACSKVRACALETNAYPSSFFFWAAT